MLLKQKPDQAQLFLPVRCPAELPSKLIILYYPNLTSIMYLPIVIRSDYTSIYVSDIPSKERERGREGERESLK
jgi:hypothetical protein